MSEWRSVKNMAVAICPIGGAVKNKKGEVLHLFMVIVTEGSNEIKKMMREEITVI